MSLPELDNLVRIGTLKPEPPEQREFDSLVQSGRRRLHDATNDSLAFESRFDLAYNAAHALALAALRWHGYRPDRQRFIVFQTLTHTLKLAPETVRVLDKAHRTRNLAEYEGALDTDNRLLAELLAAGAALQSAVKHLGPIARSSDKPG
jgi:hypothetical protein